MNFPTWTLRQQELKTMLFFFGKFTFPCFCSNASETIPWQFPLVRNTEADDFQFTLGGQDLTRAKWKFSEPIFWPTKIIGWDTSITYWNILLLPLQNNIGLQLEMWVHKANARECVQQPLENTTYCGHRHRSEAFSIAPSALVVVTILMHLQHSSMTTLQHQRFNYDDRAISFIT